MSTFWQRWLTIWCWAVLVFGVVLAGAPFDATSGPARLVFTVLNAPLEADGVHLRFSLALLGAVTIGWSVTLFAGIKAAHMLGDRGKPIWLMLTCGVVTWYVVDSILSVATGIPMNALPNTAFLAAFLVPVMQSGVLSDPAQSPASA